MGPIPSLVSDADKLPDLAKDLTQDQYAALATDFYTLSRYIRINHARCAVDEKPADTITLPP